MFWLQKRVLVVPINTLTGEVILLCWLEQLLSSHIFIWWWCVGVVSSSQWWRRDNWLCWLQLSHNSLGHAAINQKVSLIELGQRLSCIICICLIKNIDVGTLLNTLFPAKLHIHLIIKFQIVRCHSVEGCRPCDIKRIYLWSSALSYLLGGTCDACGVRMLVLDKQLQQFSLPMMCDSLSLVVSSYKTLWHFSTD